MTRNDKWFIFCIVVSVMTSIAAGIATFIYIFERLTS